jgi:hypothetical protein
MDASELKYQVENSGKESYFFDRKSMQFFGDTMRNYGVCSATILTSYDENDKYIEDGLLVEVWELFRRKAVKHGLKSSAYFDKKTFQRVYPKL